MGLRGTQAGLVCRNPGRLQRGSGMRPGSERKEKNLPNKERWGSGKSGSPEGAWVNAGHCEKAWLVGARPRVPVCISRSGRGCWRGRF